MGKRELPDYIEGYGPVIPYKGKIPKYHKLSKRILSTRQASKVTTLLNAIESAGLKDGMTISFHHHLRNGDHVMLYVLSVLKEKGIRDLTLSASSISKAHDSILPFIVDGTITKIYTSGLRSQLAEIIQKESPLKAPVVFMTHGGRARAIEAGDLEIDLAFVAASCADNHGNINGKYGESSFGAIGYPMPDVLYAHSSIIITDNLVERAEASISGDYIDYVVLVDSIGDPSLIATGSTRMSYKPMDLLIAKKASKAIIASGMIKNDLAFQAGSGAISLAVCRYLKEYMQKNNIVGKFALGGITSDLVNFLNAGVFKRLYDVQTFGLDAVESLRKNENHMEISAHDYANPNNLECLVKQLDIMILSATEIDTEFNINSLTGSNGVMIGALGGAPDTATGAKVTVVVAPSMRKRIPIIVDHVVTICTPGEFVDMLVTERGISVNPRRDDLKRLLESADIEVMDIHELKDKIHRITGAPNTIRYGDQIVGVVEYRDGTVLDVIYNKKQTEV